MLSWLMTGHATPPTKTSGASPEGERPPPSTRRVLPFCSLKKATKEIGEIRGERLREWMEEGREGEWLKKWGGRGKEIRREEGGGREKGRVAEDMG